MAKRVIFRIESPLGRFVFLSRDRWKQIIRFKHPALSGKEQSVKECVCNPEQIRASEKDTSVLLHYVSSPRGYLCVVTAPAGTDDDFIVTAYFTRNIKPGLVLWKK